MTDVSSERANPLLSPWATPHEAPPFGAIRPEHFRSAFEHAMADHMAQVDTIAALDRSGRAFTRVNAVFRALAGAHTNDDLMAIEREMAPRIAAHRNRIHLHDALYARIKALWERRTELGLSPEEARVLGRYAVTFRCAGA